MAYTLLISVDELWLKQGKRPYYMRMLSQHIQRVVSAYHSAPFNCPLDNQRLILSSAQPFSADLISPLLKIPGIHNIAKAEKTSLDFEQLVITVVQWLADKGVDSQTFAVRTQRANKQFPQTSMQVSSEVGARVLAAYPKMSVDLNQPQVRIDIKITGKNIFLATDVLKGIGGIPVGTSGHVVSLLSGGFDSPVASYLMAKRGCRLTLVFFHAYPFVGHAVKEKIKKLSAILGRYQLGCELYLIPFGAIQKKISAECKQEYRTLLFRHYMIRAADRLAQILGAQALCTGDALSQVSSQTIDNLAILDRSSIRPIFRPLVGFNKSDIITLARQIGTHDVSVEPQDDACSLLAPKHPVVKPFHKYWTYFTKTYAYVDEIEACLLAAERYAIALTGDITERRAVNLD